MEKLKKLSGKHLLFILLFIIFGVIAPIYYISGSLYGDESSHLVIGDCIRNGSVLYRDVANVKPPGSYYLSALIFSITGKSFIAARILTYIVHAASAILIFAIGTKIIKDKNVGMTAAIFFLIGMYSYIFGGYYYMAEPYAVFFILLSIFFFLKEGYRSKFIAGLALGLGILFKQTALLLFGVFFLFYLLRLRFQSNRTREYITNSVKKLILIFLGCMSPLLITLAYFFLMGAADEMLHYTVFFMSNYPISFNPELFLPSFFSYLPILLLTISMLLVIGYRFLKEKIVDDKHLFLVLWLILLSLPTIALLRLGVRVLLVIPPASLLAAQLFIDLYQNLKGKQSPDQLKCFVVITLLVTTAIAAGTNVSLVSIYSGDADEQIREAYEIEPYVEGKVYVFPEFNWVYFFSNLTPGVTFLGTINSKEIVESVIKDLQVNNISYIIALKVSVSNLVNKAKEGKLTTGNKLHYTVYEYFQENYEVLATTDSFYIYKLRGDTDV